MSARTVVVVSTHDDGGTVHRELQLLDDGTLLVVGQDLGPRVQRYFGEDEYEFVRRVEPAQVARLLETLGTEASADPLDVLRQRFSDTGPLEQHLERHGIESSFWSRTGS